MNIISQIFEDDNTNENTFNSFFKKNNISRLMKECNFNHGKGIPAITVFKIIFVLVFTHKSLSRILDNEIAFSKDVVYRFLNSVHYNWRKLLQILSSNIIKTQIFPLTSDDRVNVMIVDDSTYSRDRSKSVELLSRVKDHVTNRYIKGFKLLTLGWSDGNTFLPLDFSLMSSSNSENRLGKMKSVDKRTIGYKTRIFSQQKKTEAMLSMLKEASSLEIPAKYVLFDSWFTYPSIISKVVDIGYDVIAMVKKTPKIFYKYQGQLMNLEKIYASLNKRRGKAKILASAIVDITNESNEVIPLKIVFVRNKNKKREWLALITTDISLSEEETVRIYGKRWDIEVFFKICKSYLNLAKEFQGRYFDSMTAHTTIVFIRYIMLSIEKRKSKDFRTHGGLFYEFCDELEDIKLSEVLELILKVLVSSIREIFFATKEQIDALIDNFFQTLPNVFKGLNRNFICES
jgi:hypothetical protein